MSESFGAFGLCGFKMHLLKWVIVLFFFFNNTPFFSVNFHWRWGSLRWCFLVKIIRLVLILKDFSFWYIYVFLFLCIFLVFSITLSFFAQVPLFCIFVFTGGLVWLHCMCLHFWFGHWEDLLYFIFFSSLKYDMFMSSFASFFCILFFPYYFFLFYIWFLALAPLVCSFVFHYLWHDFFVFFGTILTLVS